MNTEPFVTPAEVVLRDGTPAMIWPLLPSDSLGLQRAFLSLSLQSRRHRFLAPVSELGRDMLRRLVDDVDQLHHIALVLIALPPDGVERPVGVGRLVQYAGDPTTAELAVTVADEWQGHGVGSALADALVRARPTEVGRLLTEVSTDNDASLAMLRRLGQLRTQLVHPGVYEVTVDLQRQPALVA